MLHRRSVGRSRAAVRTVIVATTVSCAAAAAGLRSEWGCRSKAGQRAPDTSRRSRLPGGQRHAIGRSVTTWSDAHRRIAARASHRPAADGARAVLVGDEHQRDDHVVSGAIARGGHGRHRAPGDLDRLRQRRRRVAQHVAAVLGGCLVLEADRLAGVRHERLDDQHVVRAGLDPAGYEYPVAVAGVGVAVAGRLSSGRPCAGAATCAASPPAVAHAVVRHALLAGTGSPRPDTRSKKRTSRSYTPGGPASGPRSTP